MPCKYLITAIKVDSAQKSIVKIQAGEVPPDDELDKILVVSVGYFATPMLLKKFVGFELYFYDYKTRDILFTTGHNNSFGFNTEGYTIEQTVKKAIEKITGTIPKKKIGKKTKAD